MRQSGIGNHVWEGDTSRDAGTLRVMINKPFTATAASKNKRIVSGNAEGTRHAGNQTVNIIKEGGIGLGIGAKARN